MDLSSATWLCLLGVRISAVYNSSESEDSNVRASFLTLSQSCNRRKDHFLSSQPTPDLEHDSYRPHVCGDASTSLVSDLGLGDSVQPATSFQDEQHHLGEAVKGLRHYKGVLHEKKNCEDLEIGRIAWLNEIGDFLSTQNRHEEAFEIFSQSIAIAPQQGNIWIKIGGALERLQYFLKAEQAYQAAVHLVPVSPDPWYGLSTLYTRQNMQLKAVRAYCAGYVLAPRKTKSPEILGKAYYVLGRIDEAAEVYRNWKEREPHNPIPVHLYAACLSPNNKQKIPDKCSENYIRTTFDEYADHFEKKLSELNYRGPYLVDCMMSERFSAKMALDVLDAGCGTGLCGPVLRPYARTLIGLDLSASMLGIANKKNVYDGLSNSNIEKHLDDVGEPINGCGSYDLIICIDTLIYFGSLISLFRKFSDGLRFGGSLIFTVELCSQQKSDYQLNPSGRYSHSEAYVLKAMGSCGLSCDSIRHEILRTELQAPVSGLIVMGTRR